MKDFKRYVISAIQLILLFLAGISSYSQQATVPAPEFTFSANSLLSGTDKAVGAVYRFTTVRTGVDAIVTISAAVNATLVTLDQPSSAVGGYNAAFQPNITVTKLTTGYVEFNIDFVAAGTFNPVSQSLNVTALDIDGYDNAPNQKLSEFEQFDMGAGTSAYYNLTGSDISISYIGTAVRGINVGGNEYGGINLNQNVMFTAYKAGVSSIKVRSGAVNGDQFNNVSRSHSFYFARFTYTNTGTLGISDVLGFSGKWTNNEINLSLDLVPDHITTKIEIERSNSSNGYFEKIGELNAIGINKLSFTDKTPGSDSYYRLKVYDPNGKFEYSKILRVATDASVSSADVYPTVVTNRATLAITATHAYKGSIAVMDMSGRTMSRRAISIQKGSTITNVEGIAGLRSGNYIVVIDSDTERITKRIVVANN